MKTMLRLIGFALANILFVSAVSAQTTPKLLNISTRSTVNAGGNPLIVGFATSTVTPTRQIRVLIRAVGPGLSAFGLTNAMQSVRLELYNSGNTMLRANTGWKVNPIDTDLNRTIAASVGGFPLNEDGKDCAMVVFLQPGAAYTVHAKSTDGGGGEVLIEVYEVPQP
jgi:hypothetical protein